MNDTNPSSDPVINARHLWRDFSGTFVLQDVSVGVSAGEIHALLGPNGAGKTTLLRILTGLIEPTLGHVDIAGEVPRPARSGAPSPVGLVSSSDRSFYLRLSGLENLAFFARLHGLGRRAALQRAHELIHQVGLDRAEKQRAFEYSHGMLKRLGFARALLMEPAALLVDEATHDLDPEGARTIRELTRGLAEAGTAVVWTTQRIEEIQGLADRVSVLARGEIRFSGTVQQLTARAAAPGYVVTVSNGGASGPELLGAVQAALRNRATVSASEGEGANNFELQLGSGIVLGDVFSALEGSNLTLLGCREQRPGIEEAFLKVTKDHRA
jgi:ABC-2 type transport system ATP-binding protein